jgi:hypothetical protein
MKRYKGDLSILALDIETAPNLGWVWGKWQQNVLDMKSDWYILSYAAKWLHIKGSKVVSRGLDDMMGYEKGSEDDTRLVQELWRLVNDADIIVAHNGDGFDLPKIMTRFIVHGMKPPQPFKTVDTLKIARKKFAFDSNKLDDLCRYLGLGRKLPHTGFHLWKGCMAGDKKSWNKMKKYNAHDVDLLEDLYYLFRSWDTQHPQVNETFGGIISRCPKCGSKKIQKRGLSYTMLRRKQRYQCQACAGWFEGSARK